MATSFDALPERWQDWLVNWAAFQYGRSRGELRAGDFGGCVRVSFCDGSHVLFEHSFCAVDEGNRELAVFTEHCGYHVFPLDDEATFAYSVDESAQYVQA